MTDTMTRKIADAAASAGIGVLAGLVGTAAMTLSSTVEMKINDREPSAAPADAAGAVLGVEPTGDEGTARFGNAVHWGLGAGWGAVRGLLGATGLHGPVAAGLYYGLVWGAEQVELPATGAGKPVWQYGATALATDGWHHAVYAGATSLAYEWLDRSRT